MANALTTNPIVFDTAGATSLIAANRRITGFCIHASAAAWVVVLHDADGGNIIFSRANTVVSQLGEFCPLAGPLEVTGLYATTLTNITRVLVYHEPKA